MKSRGICPKCHSTELIADAKVVDRNENWEQEMKLVMFRKPEALIFKQQEETSVSAWVCASCGFIEFYADQPHQIKF